MKKIYALSAFLLLNAFLIESANAAVVIRFKEIGGDVVATTSGDFLIPFGEPDDILQFGGGVNGATALAHYQAGDEVWFGGTSISSNLLGAQFTAEGDTFGYDEPVGLFLPLGLLRGSVFTPNTTWTWSGQTISSLGLSALTASPFQVFEYEGDTISFALATVPEPTTTALLMSGAIATFTATRRRKR